MKEIKDTDLDSWDSGDNQPDVFDNVKYNNMPVDDDYKEKGESLLSSIDEDVESGEADNDIVTLDNELLDDSNYNDNTFDCD